MDLVSRCRQMLPVVLGLALCFFLGATHAEAPPGIESMTATSAPSGEEAEVIVFNRRIVTFRSSFLGHSASARAERSRQAVIALVESSGPGIVTVKQAPQGAIVMLDDQIAFLLQPADADLLRERLFPWRARLRGWLAECYYGRIPTRCLPRLRSHRLRYAV